MIQCIFTIDYEIYGNGSGSLRELVYDPAEKLKELFRKYNVPLVVFVEAAELEVIEAHGTDNAIDSVRFQLREFHRRGFEIGLHLHPQWYNAEFHNGQWFLDYSEYNLCILQKERIAQIVKDSIAYLRNVLEHSNFNPVSFRAGNWLFQPTNTAAAVLAKSGIRIDSSVFKGGRQRNHNLDYRLAMQNPYFWKFGTDANVPDIRGVLLEVPTHCISVPFWRMLTRKRVRLHQKGPSTPQNARQKVNRLLDILRFRYPLKFDFCRMTLGELTSTLDRVILEDRTTPDSYKPIVAIGHTKDLVDVEVIDAFLSYLKRKAIAVVNLQDTLSTIGATSAQNS